jgi:DNA polymerase (family 10)
MSLNDEISDLFANLAALMELKGENTFKVIAFQKVSRIVREMNFDLRECLQNNTLCEIEGIGKTSQQIIEEYINSGKSTVFEEIAAAVPKGLVPLLTIEGLGPKTIHLLWQERDITSLEQLEAAISSGALKGIKGIGDKKIETIQRGIDSYKSRAADGSSGAVKRIGIVEALIPAEDLLDRVRQIPGVVRAEIAGSLRRRKETIADIDFVGAVDDPELATGILEQFTQSPGVVQILGQGGSKASVKIGNGMQVDLRIVPAENFGAALLYFTGSKEHNVKVRSLALKKKMTLNEWGLYKLDEYEKAKKETAKAPPIAPVASKSEDDVYKKLGLDFIEPELREDHGEIELAASKQLPDLITLKDIKGDLHTHTNASDGTATLEEMALAAKAKGYLYLAITDHSKALAMTNGLSVERVLAHAAAIRKLNDKLKGITLLAGTECDILADGRMDYEDEVLKELDIVIASPHLSLKQDTKKSTDRLLRAIENPYVNIIGHPTGRLINRREGLPLDMPRILKAAAQTGTALEINASYPRLDLNDQNAAAAREAGCVLSIDTDAHSVGELDLLPHGISVARRAWLTPKHVINTWALSKLRDFIRVKRPK